MYNPFFDFEETSAYPSWQSVYRSLVDYIVPANVPSSAIIACMPDERIVLIRRTSTDSWSLPGGEIAWGETIHKNVRRKLTAETGLELVEIKHMAGLYFPTDNSQARSFTEVVVADVRGKFEIKDSTEVAEASFFSLDKLPTVDRSAFSQRNFSNLSPG